MEHLGARLTIVAVPSVDDVYRDRWADVAAAIGPLPPGVALVPGTPEKRLGDVARAEGIAFLELRPALAAAGVSRRDLYFPVNHHWTARGHEVVAAAMAVQLGAQ